MKKKKNLIIISIFSLVVLIGLVVGMFILRSTPTTINRATEPMCPANGASCSWESDGTATSFKVEIIDHTTGKTLLSTTTSNKAIQFTPETNHKYSCNVTPINSCGEGPRSSATNTCIPKVTNTPTPTIPPTATPTPSVVSCQKPSTCMTQEACSTSGGTTNGEQCADAGTICCVPPDSTPTPTPKPSDTPVPTATLTPTATATPIPTYTPAPTSTPIPTSTPYPTYTPYPTATTGPSATPGATWTPAPTYTPQPTYTGYPSPTPTEIIIVVNNTSTPTPTVEGTAAPTIPAAGIPVGWYVMLIPLVLLGLGLIF